jgi:hypothetical protein
MNSGYSAARKAQWILIALLGGIFMKKAKFYGIVVPILLAQMLLLQSCQNEEDLGLENVSAIEKQKPQAVTSQTLTIERVTSPVNEIALPVNDVALPISVPEPVIPPYAYHSPTPLTDPMVFARSIFDDNIPVDPWLANYVGSYAQVPSRFQDKGPFLYSFDVSTDAVRKHEHRRHDRHKHRHHDEEN